MWPYLRPPWTNSCQIWCVRVFSLCSTETWSWKCQIAKKKIWWHHTSVLYKKNTKMKFQNQDLYDVFVETPFWINLYPMKNKFNCTKYVVSAGLLWIKLVHGGVPVIGNSKCGKVKFELWRIMARSLEPLSHNIKQLNELGNLTWSK